MNKLLIFTITSTLAMAMLSNDALTKTRHLFCGALQCDLKGKSVTADPKNGLCCAKAMVRGKKIGGHTIKLYCKGEHKYYKAVSHKVLSNAYTLTCLTSSSKLRPSKSAPHTYQELKCWYAKKKTHAIFTWKCKDRLW